MRYERILAPLKRAEIDARVLDHAVTLAGLCGASVTLLHVVHSHTRDALTLLREEAEAYLRDQQLVAAAAGAVAETLVLEGEPAEGIEEALAITHADLVVMGSHGHGQVHHFLLGSVTESVIRRGDVAVLLVKAE